MHTLLLVMALAQTDVTAPAWLAGCWRQQSPSRTVDEMWMAPAGDGMLGMSRTVMKGRIVEHEFLQIRMKDGRLVYVANPSGQSEATFSGDNDRTARVGLRERGARLSAADHLSAAA